MAAKIEKEVADANANAKKAPGPFEILKKACSSKLHFMEFVVNPQHYMFLGLVGVATYGTASLVWQCMINTIGVATQLAFVELAILWVSAIVSLFQTTIQEQIDWFRGLNTKLAKQVEELKSDIAEMTEQCDKLGENLARFDELRKAMESEAAKMGVSLDNFKKSAGGVFERMAKLHYDQEKTLLLRVSADVMFRDDEQGLSMHEFKDFCSRVPRKYRDNLGDPKKREELFKQVAGEDGLIDNTEIEAFIDKIVNEQLAEEAAA